MPTILERQIGSLLGLACGDAVGTTVEFCARGQFEPVKDMIGGGPFHLVPGQWTDDTSMALCLAESLLECDGFNAWDQMDRYQRWYREGYLSATGRCFDIGHTVRAALKRYHKTGNPIAGSVHPHTSGNGALMRLAPVVIYYTPRESEVLAYSALSSATTHASPECLDAAMYMGWWLHRLYMGQAPTRLLRSALDWLETDAVTAISQGKFIGKSRSEIRGSGYVVESLEAAFWCLFQSDSFESAVLMATNLGDDADTTAAICGQLAGAFYGVQAIPQHWRQRVWWGERIEQLAFQLATSRQASLKCL